MTIPFRPIARLLTSTLHPAPRVDISAARELLSQMGRNGRRPGVLLTANHYSAIDFHSWWFVIILSAIIPRHVHWVVSAGWTHSGWLTGVTHWLFPLGARILGFTPMPAMPPDPGEIENRAVSVRRVLDYARHTPSAVIGLTPEGRDCPQGVLGSLPGGAGRFMYLLSQFCPAILPVGIWKENGTIMLKFGCPYALHMPGDLSPAGMDEQVGRIVMRHIAELIPEQLRGEYA